MFLLLSSYVLTADALRGLRTPLPRPVGGRAGIVLNALDQFGPTRDYALGRERRTFEECGYRCTELDLRSYFGRPDALAAHLAELDLVWALGGNVFVLARAMDAAGFGPAVRQQAARPEFVYGGFSAGACVAGPDLRGLDLVDDATLVPDGYPPDARPVGLGLVPFRIVPHWRSDSPDAPGAERAVQYLAAAGLDHRALRDGEAVDGQGAPLLSLDN